MVKRKGNLHSANNQQDSHGNNSHGSKPLPLLLKFSTHCDPESAARQVQELLNLSESKLHVLIDELNRTDEDPILALLVNPEWIAMHGEAMADEVLNFIASFELSHNMRRDFEGAHNLLFHINQSMDIFNCRKATSEKFCQGRGQAFTFSPIATAAALALGAVGVSSVPLASGAIIHKLAVCQDGVHPYNFFYF